MAKTTKKFYLGMERNGLGSYGVRKSSSSRRGDNKALHPVSFRKWKCWGRSSTESNEMKAASKSSTCNRERRWLDYTLSRENN